MNSAGCQARMTKRNTIEPICQPAHRLGPAHSPLGGNLADREVLVEAVAAARDAYAFVSLDAGALALGDLDVDDDRIAGLECRHLRAGQFGRVLGLNLLDDVHVKFAPAVTPAPGMPASASARCFELRRASYSKARPKSSGCGFAITAISVRRERVAETCRVRLRRSGDRMTALTHAGRLIGGAAFAFGLAAAAAGAQTNATPQPLPNIVQGSAGAPATIAEYASMTCSHCAAFHKTVWPGLKAKYIDTGKAKFILREFPLDPLATAAFMLACCAGPGKRDAVVDRLFDHQADWAFAANP